MRHIIDAIAAQGRNGDDELLHVTKGEMAGLDALARRHFGRELSRNPRTGLKEASLFTDWFGNDVGQVLDVAAPVATAFIPGVGIPAAAAMGAGIGAANKGLGKGGTTEGALMGGIAGGIGAYGGGQLSAGLDAAASAGTSAATPTVGLSGMAGPGADAGTAAFTQSMNQTLGTGAESTLTPGMQTAFGEAAKTSATPLSDLAAQGVPNAANNVTTAAGQFSTVPQTVNLGGAGTEGLANISPDVVKPVEAPATAPKYASKMDYLTSKDALKPMTQIATSGMMSLANTSQATDPVTGEPVDNSMHYKGETYYTPYGERRTRAVPMAQGGLAGFGDYDAADAQPDGGYRPGGPVGYADGGGIGFIRSMQPGGAWGDATADLYGVVDKNAPWLNDMQPGGFMGALQPGRMDYEDKVRNQKDEEARKQQEAEAQAKANAERAAFNQQWSDRYNAPVNLGMAQGGLASMAQGRYLQGPGDGMSDSIHANIDGKQEARLATGEFVVPADVVSGLGNGDSNAGAKQLHAMMDRTRQARTGTKKQGKQINPRKVMPT